MLDCQDSWYSEDARNWGSEWKSHCWHQALDSMSAGTTAPVWVADYLNLLKHVIDLGMIKINVFCHHFHKQYLIAQSTLSCISFLVLPSKLPQTPQCCPFTHGAGITCSSSSGLWESCCDADDDVHIYWPRQMFHHRGWPHCSHWTRCTLGPISPEKRCKKPPDEDNAQILPGWKTCSFPPCPQSPPGLQLTSVDHWRWPPPV